MSGLLQYRPLFTVNMLHDYYLSEDMELYEDNIDLRSHLLALQNRNYQLFRDLVIAPTLDSDKKLKDLRFIFKPTNRGFFVGTQVSQISGVSPAAFAPFISLDENIRLRFSVNIKNAYFYNMTNLRMEKDSTQQERYIYYFSNRAGNIVSHTEGDRLYLSRPMPGFDPGTAYEAGELILNGANLMEAVEDILPGNPFETNQWRAIYVGQTPHFQFIGAGDRLPLRPSIFGHTVFSATENHESLLIRLRDREGVLLDTFRYRVHNPLDPAPTLRQCTLDLSNFQAGIYSIETELPDGTLIPAFGLTFYLDDLLYRQRPLALIECFHETGPVLGAYRWTDETNENRLLQPVYHLRWKSRATFWRYYYEAAPAFTSTDVESLAVPNNQTLRTVAPLALSQISRRVEINLNGGNAALLPNPGVEAIFPGNGRVFSEINMGGGLGPPAP